MTHRIRLAILGAIAVVAAIALTGSGLASAAMARVGTAVLPASAAVHPSYVDVTSQYRSEPGWGVGGISLPASAAGGAVAGSRVVGHSAPAAATVAGPAVVAGGPSLRDIELARAGMTPAPGCSGAACGSAGCGFLAPGCAVLDCSLLNPACGLGVPVSSCGILDPGCGFGGFGGCGVFGSRCGFGFGDDDNFGGRFRFRDIFWRDRFFHRHLVDHHGDR
ncbi:MAG TPA: hypothetical protein VGL20_15830 [Candidatus Dormibacteraeota bacterium]|jgi:hypothetical protein